MTRKQLIGSLLVGLAAVGGATSVETQAQSSTNAPRVRVLLYLVDLQSIDGSQQSFTADVVVSARWNDPTLAGNYDGVRSFSLDEVWHPILLIVNEQAITRSLPQVVNVDPDGNAQYTFRTQGTFGAPMDLKAFPLDHQELSVWVIAPPLGGNLIEIVPDSSARVLNRGELSISDWEIGELALESREFTATPFGVPFSGVALTMRADRKLGYYIIQVLIPLIAIVLMAGTVFWIDASVVPTRVGVVVTTMLTLIAYRFMLNDLVPRLSYLTRLDYFMLGVTSLVVLTLFTMAATSYLRSREQHDVVARIDRFGRVAFPSAFLVFSILVWFF